MSVNPNQSSDPLTAMQPDSPQGWIQLAETYYAQKSYETSDRSLSKSDRNRAE
ncbi:MAG: hypothetical protein RSE13_22160 [Planktothrix sp. GU0601_MAG3]|nr:MAG: hypothetical protein RSE13_22160 [Planktothrix sp. GU0601_MAG3]